MTVVSRFPCSEGRKLAVRSASSLSMYLVPVLTASASKVALGPQDFHTGRNQVRVPTRMRLTASDFRPEGSHVWDRAMNIHE